MARATQLVKGLLTAALFMACFTQAHAQATRTWVSGVGDDVNPCSRTAPCKTFQGAISKTASGGEIDVLDPGGFGAVTITKSITIDGGGFIAGVLVAGTNGIVVNAGTNDEITLRNLQFNGLGRTGSSGLDGIKFFNGKGLHVDHCKIFGFNQNGIEIIPSNGGIAEVTVNDTIIDGQFAPGTGDGIKFTTGKSLHVEDCKIFNASAYGIEVNPSDTTNAPSPLIRVSHTSIHDNVTGGIYLHPTVGVMVNANLDDVALARSNFGLRLEDNTNVVARNCSITGNNNNGVFVYSSTSPSSILLERSTITHTHNQFNNANGINVVNAGASARLNDCSITYNDKGLNASSSGAIFSYQNNVIDNNTANGSTPTPVNRS